MARMVGLDLGSAFTRIWTQDGGIVLRCPSAAAIDSQSHELVAVGAEARRMLGKTPQDILAYRPIRDGLVSEFEVAARMVYALFRNKQICSTFNRPVVLLATPYRIDQSQRLTAENTVFEGGARAVAQIPAVFAAAIGAGLRVSSPYGSMVLNMGAGLSEAAIVSSGGIIAAHSIRVGGEKLDAAIANYLKQHRNLVIGIPTAESLKVQIGTASPHADRGVMTVYGRNARTGLACHEEVTSAEICEAITPAIDAIARATLSVLENAPPEIASDIHRYGLMLCGGCANLHGLPEAIAAKTRLRVTVARRPMDCTIEGLGRIIKNPKLWDASLEYRLR